MEFITLRRLLAPAALVAALFSTPALAYEGLFVFGDSLSDNGNVSLAVGSDPTQVVTGNSYIPSLPYASGTFSDGVVWADRLASKLGVVAAPSLAGGTNYAFGGARTRNESGGSPSLRSQVSQFLSDTGGVASSDGLYVLAGGGNNARDALNAIGGGAPIRLAIGLTAKRYADDLSFMVGQLQAAGATDIVVWNTPNLGLTPAVTAEGPLASVFGSVIAQVMNRALSNRLFGIEGVQVFDLYGLVSGAVGDPGSVGLTNAVDACGAVLGCNPADYLFWDGIHPTSGGHALIANAMMAAVVPEPAAAWLFASGLVLVWARRRSLR